MKLDSALALDLYRQDLLDLNVFQDVAQVLATVGLDPVLVHLEDVVRFVRARAVPVKRGPGLLERHEDLVESFLRTRP